MPFLERTPVTTHSRKRSFLAGISAVAASAMLIIAGGSAAQAAPSIPTGDGSITVHKFVQPAVNGADNNGLELPTGATDGWTPLAGAEFTAKLVPGIDLTTNAGWLAAQQLSVSDAATAAAGSPGIASGLTGADGLATIAPLPIGLYLVEETTTPAGHIGAAPFLVTIPMTHPTDLDKWISDVHVYPKNATIGSKTVEDKDAIQLGDSVVWTIKGAVQAPASGQKITGYAIADKLDAKLTYQATPGAVATITQPDAVAGQLIAGTDYKVTVFASSNTVAAILTATGLEKLTAAKLSNPTTEVQLVVPTVVNAVGEIENTGLIFPNGEGVDQGFGGDPGNPTDPTDPTDKCEENCYTTPGAITKWGDITFTKVNDATPAVGLAGAEFQIYAVDPSTTGATPLELSIDDLGTKSNTFVSTADGTVVIPGLRYSNWANGVLIDDNHDDFQPYWIVETKAPEGFELLAQPIKVKLNEKVVVLDGAAAGDFTNLVNVKKNAGFELPLTGGAGTWMLTAGGLLLIVGGGVLAIRRKKATAQA